MQLEKLKEVSQTIKESLESKQMTLTLVKNVLETATESVKIDYHVVLKSTVPKEKFRLEIVFDAVLLKRTFLELRGQLKTQRRNLHVLLCGDAKPLPQLGAIWGQLILLFSSLHLDVAFKRGHLQVNPERAIAKNVGITVSSFHQQGSGENVMNGGGRFKIEIAYDISQQRYTEISSVIFAVLFQ